MESNGFETSIVQELQVKNNFNEENEEKIFCEVDPLNLACNNGLGAVVKTEQMVHGFFPDLIHENDDSNCYPQMKNQRNDIELLDRNGHLWKYDYKEHFEENIEIVPKQFGAKGPAILIKTPIDAWQLLIDDPMMSIILCHTNEEIRKQKKTISDHSYCTDSIELKAWFGLNYIAGLWGHLWKDDLSELWSNDTGIAIFRATMPEERFIFLTDCIRFSKENDNSTIMDSMCPIKAIWDKFIINCRSYYSPTDYCTIGEQIIPIDDVTCPLRTFIPNSKQHHQLGIRLVMINDAETYYMFNAMEAGSSTPPESHVTFLVRDLNGSKRNITTTSRYTSVKVADKLTDLKLTLVGILDNTSQDIPLKYLEKTNENHIVTEYAYDDRKTICRYSPHPNITEYILTTTTAVGLQSQLVEPYSWIVYKKTYEASDNFIKFCNKYTVSPPILSVNETTKLPYRWPLRFWFTIMDQASTNAFILLKLTNDNAFHDHRKFVQKLGLELIDDHMRRRLKRDRNLSLSMKALICEILGEPLPKIPTKMTAQLPEQPAFKFKHLPVENIKYPKGLPLYDKSTVKRRRCRVCPNKADRKTKMQCQQCTKPLCWHHIVIRCKICTGIVEDDELPVIDKFPRKGTKREIDIHDESLMEPESDLEQDIDMKKEIILN